MDEKYDVMISLVNNDTIDTNDSQYQELPCLLEVFQNFFLLQNLITIVLINQSVV